MSQRRKKVKKLQASNLKWANFVHEKYQFKHLLCYLCSIVNKYWLMWFEIILVFILFKKKKKNPNISGIWVVYK